MKYLKYYKENIADKFSREGRFNASNIKKIIDSYLETALWLAPDDDSEQSNFENKSIYDFSKEAIEQAKLEIEWFISIAGDLILSNNISDEAIGHDLWLTRTRQGTGFWDRGYKKEDEEELSKLCDVLGEIWIELGDDGKIYFTPSNKFKDFDVEKWKEERKLKRDTNKYNL